VRCKAADRGGALGSEAGDRTRGTPPSSAPRDWSEPVDSVRSGNADWSPLDTPLGEFHENKAWCLLVRLSMELLGLSEEDVDTLDRCSSGGKVTVSPRESFSNTGSPNTTCLGSRSTTGRAFVVGGGPSIARKDASPSSSW
jgi:hypothetical protein